MAQCGRDKSNKLKQSEIHSIISTIFEDVLEPESKALQSKVDRNHSQAKAGGANQTSEVDLKARSFLQAINLIGDSDGEQAQEDVKEEEPETVDQ
jgi:hypothetical protein